ncbi:hypothetical protein AEP_00455 [Curvibacter sp. AEP1-3]|uniref:hypothetical protein n=1 Tax=Curvibacter sp. AEP1-3 TaxID=1844971 RepID=UPI000B3C427E|nr:hypothetical protein [Curvibacter sp. AEP1-3]ARV17417.1 hypothetical protein AEP_00455 [Curvibacter sp. AEP1-3]QDB70154.1 hypothetical protein [Curvibacter phage TJ1]
MIGAYLYSSAQVLGLVAGYLYVFWLLYVLIMGFYRAYLSKRLTKPALVLASPALFVGVLVDLIANWTLATVWFLEFPQRPLELVTDRLSRYIGLQDDCWHKTHAVWVCQNLLDYFDPHDKHCVSES